MRRGWNKDMTVHLKTELKKGIKWTYCSIVEKGIEPIVEINDETGVNVPKVEKGVNGANVVNGFHVPSVDKLENTDRGS